MSNEQIQDVEPITSVAVQPESVQATNLIQVIERAAVNPDVDIDKMERLLQMKERLDAKAAEQEFSIAMAESQKEMSPIAKDADGESNKYASYAAIDRVLRPIYTKNGFALSFGTEDGAPELEVRVVCYVSHIAGHTRKVHIDIPADGKGPKGGAVMTRTHATGSAATYGMRYLLKMIFNVAVGEADDDGNGAGRKPVELITDEQAIGIHAKLSDNEIPLPPFLKWLATAVKAESIEAIQVNVLDTVNRRIDSAIRAKEKNSA